MKSIFYYTVIISIAISAGSCSKKKNDDSQQQNNIQVVSVPNQDVIVLDADQTVEILKKAGFSDSQIKQHGSSIREGLAKSGAVRILIDNVVEAGFAARGDQIYVSTRSNGYYIYNIKTGWVDMQR